MWAKQYDVLISTKSHVRITVDGVKQWRDYNQVFFKKIGVLMQGYGEDFFATSNSGFDSNAFNCSYDDFGATRAEYLLSGNFDRNVTIFTFNKEAETTIPNKAIDVIGVESIKSESGSSAQIDVIFPGGNTVRFTASNGGYTNSNIRYTYFPSHHAGFTNAHNVPYSTGFSLINPKENWVEYRKIINSESELGAYYMICSPVYSMYTTSFTPWFSSMGPFSMYPYSAYGYESFPSSPASQNSIDKYKNYIENLTTFWNQVDSYQSSSIYMIQTLVGVGGSVNPINTFASANEPRMFTVTPDEHHGIHSVTAYNNMTNQQIPLQESGMDLLTGAKSYMFTMPAANVRIIVEFRSIEITIPVTVKYTSPRGKVFTTSFNLLYDDTEQREETAPPVEEQEGENQNE